MERECNVTRTVRLDPLRRDRPDRIIHRCPKDVDDISHQERTPRSTRGLADACLLSPWDSPPCLCLQFVYTGCMAAETTTVRVRRPDSERLQSLAKARQTAVIDVVHAAIDALERQEFLRGLNGDYQRLRNDPELWEQYLAERQEWDALA